MSGVIDSKETGHERCKVMFGRRSKREFPTPIDPGPRWETCPDCGSTRHSLRIEEGAAGEVAVKRRCRACGAVWGAESSGLADPSEVRGNSVETD
jgi:hypothetical protein